MLDGKIKRINKRNTPAKIKVMWFSNHPNFPTGFSKISREVCKELAKDSQFEVYYVSEHYHGPPINQDGYLLLGVKPLPHKNPMEMSESVVTHVNHFKPHFFVCLEDTFTLGESNFNFQNINFGETRFVIYVPLDGGSINDGGGSIPTTGITVSRLADHLIAMSKFTQKELKKEGFESDMIWHHVDTSIFKPVTKEEQTRLKIKHGFKPEDFVVFSYMRNSMRKRPARHLQVLYEFLKDKKDAKALLHVMNWRSKDCDFLDLFDRNLFLPYKRNLYREGIIKMTPYPNQTEKSLDDKEVAEMIQMSDLVFTATSGEGVGLIMLESMACSKPVVATDYTTPYEFLIEGEPSPRGKLARCDAFDTAGLNTTHALVNINDMVSKMNEYYFNRTELEEDGKRGRSFAENNLTLGNIIKQWKAWFVKNA